MRATGMPICIAMMTVSTAPARSGNWHTAAEIASGTPYSRSCDLGDDAERAFRADEEPRQVVAGARFARAAAGVHDLPVGGDDGEPEHVLAHGAVAHGVGARRARRRHAAERRVGARVDRKEQACALELGVELLARHARLHAAVEVGGVDLEHAVHARQVEAHAAVAARRRALRATCRRRTRSPERAPRGTARTMAATSSLLSRIDDDVGRRAVGQAFAVAVMLAHRAAEVTARSPKSPAGVDTSASTTRGVATRERDCRQSSSGFVHVIRNAAARDAAAAPWWTMHAADLRAAMQGRHAPCPD